MSDEALVQAHQAGVPGAAEVLLARHRPSVERICRGRLPDREAVQDAVQETMLLCLKALGTFTGGELFGRYAKVVAVSVCRRSGPGRRAEVGLDEEAAGRIPAREASLEERCVDSLVVQRILAELSPADSALLLRHHGEDRPLVELAAEQGASLTAVKVRLHRARQRARAVAQRQGAFGLLPVPVLLPRLREAWTRFAGHRPEVLVGCALVAPALLVGLPHADLGLRPPPASAPAAVLRAVGAHAPAAAVPDRSAAASQVRPDAGPGGAAGPTRAAAPPDAVPPGPRSAVAFAPVPLPLVQRTVAPSPPRRAPDHSFEVADPSGSGALVGVDTYDEEHAAEACGVAGRAPVLLTCRAGASTTVRIGP